METLAKFCCDLDYALVASFITDSNLFTEVSKSQQSLYINMLSRVEQHCCHPPLCVFAHEVINMEFTAELIGCLLYIQNKECTRDKTEGPWWFWKKNVAVNKYVKLVRHKVDVVFILCVLHEQHFVFYCKAGWREIENYFHNNKSGSIPFSSFTVNQELINQNLGSFF